METPAFLHENFIQYQDLLYVRNTYLLDVSKIPSQKIAGIIAAHHTKKTIYWKHIKLGENIWRPPLRFEYDHLPSKIRKSKLFLSKSALLENLESNKFEHDKENNSLYQRKAGKFSANQLLHLHEIRDNTKNTTGIILCGPPPYFKKYGELEACRKTRNPITLSKNPVMDRLRTTNYERKKAFWAEHGILAELADEIAKDSKDFGTLENKILECRIVVTKYLKYTKSKT